MWPSKLPALGLPGLHQQDSGGHYRTPQGILKKAIFNCGLDTGAIEIVVLNKIKDTGQPS